MREEKLPLLVLQAILNKYEQTPSYASNIGTKSEEKEYNPNPFVLTKSMEANSPYSQFLKFPRILKEALIGLGYVEVQEPKIEAANKQEEQLAEFLKNIYPKIRTDQVDKYCDVLLSLIEKLRNQLDIMIPSKIEIDNLFEDLSVLDPRFLLLIELVENKRKPLTISTETIKKAFNALPITLQNALIKSGLAKTDATQADRREKELELFLRDEFPNVVNNQQVQSFYKALTLSTVMGFANELRNMMPADASTTLLENLSILDEKFLPLLAILKNKNKPYYISSDIIKKQFDRLPESLKKELKEKGYVKIVTIEKS